MKKYLLLILFSFIIVFTSCVGERKAEPITIGISKGAPEEYYGNYSRWLSDADSTIICVDLYHMPLDSALLLLEECSGLLISGGPDVYPGRYDRPQGTYLRKY